MICWSIRGINYGNCEKQKNDENQQKINRKPNKKYKKLEIRETIFNWY